MRNIRQQIFQAFLHKYIGVDYNRYDCWELTKLFYVELMGIDLDEVAYDDPNNKKNVSRLIEIERQKFSRIHSPSFGDIIVFKILGIASHLGIYVGDGKFLHTMNNTGCVVDNLSKWKWRVEGFYRHDQIKEKRS